MPQRDAIVVGSGPNGLAAAIELARAGWSVTVYEAHDTIGGGTRTAELTLPGLRHDICSAIHPLGFSSPFFSMLPLEEWGLEWIHPELPLAHPFDDGSAAVLARSFEETADALSPNDGQAWRRLMQPLSDHWGQLLPDVLGPLHMPRHPLLLVQFGMRALQSARGLAERSFEHERARTLFAGIAAHVMMPLEHMPTAAFGLILGAAGHAAGWPLPRGGSQSIANSLGDYFQRLGGRIVTGHEVQNVDALPTAEAVLLDLTPRQIVHVAGHRLPDRYTHALERYRYGAGICKIDWALSEPVPWTADACRRAGTVHLGGSLDEIAHSETAAWQGRPSEKPFVLVAQQSLFDPTRTPDDRHTLWAYCHVPHDSTTDVTDLVERQIERFAPGFRDTVLDRRTMTARQVELYNPNYVGGDINGGAYDLRQLFTRPVMRWDPYTTPADGLFVCSSATPPGGGVHGMCGYHAARSVLRRHG